MFSKADSSTNLRKDRKPNANRNLASDTIYICTRFFQLTWVQLDLQFLPWSHQILEPRATRLGLLDGLLYLLHLSLDVVSDPSEVRERLLGALRIARFEEVDGGVRHQGEEGCEEDGHHRQHHREVLPVDERTQEVGQEDTHAEEHLEEAAQGAPDLHRCYLAWDGRKKGDLCFRG